MNYKESIRKAHTNLTEAEDNLMSSLKNQRPELVQRDEECPACVLLEHSLADANSQEMIAQDFQDAE